MPRAKMSAAVLPTLFLLTGIAFAAPAAAVLCAADTVPAATLLVPHFQVDLDACGSPDGLNTQITIQNAVAASTVVHVTLWTDWAMPSITFSLYLTGFDVETLDLAAAFCDGSLPITGPTVSPHGPLSDPAPSLPTCDIIFPFPDPVIVGVIFDRLRNAHTGVFDATFDGCAGQDFGDNVARGYVTLDVVNDCSLLFPSDAGYFAGTASNENRLLGEYRYLGGSNALDVLQPALHIEADPTGQTFQPGDHTFYGRYVGGDASDQREPLPTRLGGFWRDEVDAAESEWRIWRETAPHGTAPACGSSPGWLVSQPVPVLAFDDEENPAEVLAGLPLASQELPFDDLLLAALGDRGKLDFDLRHDGLLPIYGDDLSQSWAVRIDRTGTGGARTVARDLAPLDNVCAATTGRVFLDGFETGDLSRWSGSLGRLP